MRPETREALKSWNTLLDMGPGENEGCITEPDIFRERLAKISDDELRHLLYNLDCFLDKHKRTWNK